MRRTLAVAVFPALVIAAVWLRLERPVDELWRVAAVVALALAPALVRPLRLRILAVAAALVLSVRIGLGLSILDARPFDSRHDFFGPLGSRFSNGFLDFYDVRTPFDPRVHTEMRGVVLAAVFGFVLALGLAVAARRPVAAAIVLVLGAGWPATLVGGAGALGRGVAILLGVLVVLGGLTARRVPRVALPAAAAVALVALAVSSSPAVAKQELVGWQRWDFYNAPQAPVSVSYVWNGQYEGITWAPTRTTVLRGEGAGDVALLARRAARRLQRRPLARGPAAGRRLARAGRVARAREPRPPAGDGARARRHAARRRQRARGVRRRGRAARPARAGPRAPALRADARLPVHGLELCAAADARPTRELAGDVPGRARLAGRIPRRLARGDGAAVRRGRSPRAVDALLDAHPEIARYTQLEKVAFAVAGSARTPYAAAIDLESWFRTRGGFRYTDHPAVYSAAPLVGFVAETRAGYCQYFAGAMALMLRYLGVPARVAVGFSSGSYDANNGRLDGHRPRRPRLGRGLVPRLRLAAVRSRHRRRAGPSRASSARRTRRRRAASTCGAPEERPPGPARASPRRTAHRHGESSPAGTAAASAGGGTGRGVDVVAHELPDRPALVLGIVLAGIVATKLAVRRARYLTRDPRRVAAACRRELADFLIDQRIEAARSATLHELGALVRRELAVDPDPFVAAATAARFGRPDGADRAARDARRELRALVRRRPEAARRRERLRGLLSLRSLGFAPYRRLDVSA